MSAEFGIFTEEGCIENGFYSRAEAEEAVKIHYPEEECHIAECCVEHREEEHENCAECMTEEAENEEAESCPRPNDRRETP